jgi:hypothetical protein
MGFDRRFAVSAPPRRSTLPTIESRVIVWRPRSRSGNPFQGGHNVTEQQQRQRVLSFCRQARSDARRGRATTLAGKCCAGVGL